MRRSSAIAAGLAALVAVAGFAGWQWFEAQLAPVSASPQVVVFRVERGATLPAVARALEAQGLIRNATAFRLHARRTGRDGSLRAGEYELAPALPADEILERLVRGNVRTHAVAIPEGLRMEAIAARLADAGLVDRDAFLAIARDPASAAAYGVEGETLEGYLFPETYRLARGLDPDEVVGALVGQFLRVWAGIEPLARARGLSMHDVVTLASIVEKETAVPDERPLIAAVFLNRLERGMRLETDPTVIYGIADFDGNLRRRDLADETNPYNTYRIPGLPPGPIANPGAGALRAVVEPAETPYLFFVALGDGSGRHAFSVTYREHQANVTAYLRRRRR